MGAGTLGDVSGFDSLKRSMEHLAMANQVLSRADLALRFPLTNRAKAPMLGASHCLTGAWAVNSAAIEALRPLWRNIQSLNRSLGGALDHRQVFGSSLPIPGLLRASLFPTWMTFAKARENEGSLTADIPRLIAERRRRGVEQIAAGVLEGIRALKLTLENVPPAPRRADCFPTPAGARWEEVNIRFLNGHDVEVRVRDVVRTLDHVRFGLSSSRNGLPTEQWKLLEAFGEERGRLTWESSHAHRKNAKRKELLAKALREFFGIEGDPFRPFQKGWAARFSVSIEE